jgi:hypothetical protein
MEPLKKTKNRKENKKKLIKSETEPVYTRSAMQQTMAIKGAHSRGSLPRNVPNSHSAHFTTDTSTSSI